MSLIGPHPSGSPHASFRDHFTGPRGIDNGECFTERLIALACVTTDPACE
jgi:hypothetical protein